MGIFGNKPSKATLIAENKKLRSDLDRYQKQVRDLQHSLKISRQTVAGLQGKVAVSHRFQEVENLAKEFLADPEGRKGGNLSRKQNLLIAEKVVEAVR